MDRLRLSTVTGVHANRPLSITWSIRSGRDVPNQSSDHTIESRQRRVSPPAMPTACMSIV